MSEALGIEIRDDSCLSVAHINKTPFGIKVKSYRMLKGSADELSRGLKGFIHEIGVEGIPLSIGLPGGSVISKALRIPANKREDLRGIMAFEIERHIPFSVQDACYDFYPLKKDGNLWDVIMVAAKKDMVDRYVEYLKDVPVELICIDARPFSTFNALSYWNRLPGDKRIAIVLSGPDAIEVDIFEGDVPVGSRSIPIDEERGLKWIETIEREIKVCMGGMDAPVDHKGPDEILIIADRRIDEKSRSILERNTGVPVTIESPEGHNLPQGTSISAFGLALRGVGKGRLKLNLFPAAFERKAAGPVPSIILTGIVILMGIAIGVSTSIRDRLALSRLDVAVKEILPETTEVKILKKRLKNVQEKLMTLERVRVVPPPLELLKELTEVLPHHTWLTSMDYNRGEVSLIGLSDQASSLLPFLEGSDLLEDVEFIGSITTEPGGKERFKIKATVNRGTVPIYRQSKAER